jgi:hypothetical protein
MDYDKYMSFLRDKVPQAESCGVLEHGDFHESLKPHQRDIASWAVQGGFALRGEAAG